MEEKFWEFEDVPMDQQSKLDEQKEDVLPAILSPRNTITLIQILNELDGNSFSKLARTCRYLRHSCFNLSGVKIPIDLVVDVTGAEFHVWIGEENHLYDKNPNPRYLTSAQIDRLLDKKSMRRFSIQMIRFIGARLDGQRMSATQEFLTKFGSNMAERLWIQSDVHLITRLETLIPFVNELGVKEFRSDHVLPGGAASILLKNMSYFHYDHDASKDFYLQAQMPPRLHLMGTNRWSSDSFLEILEKWTAGDIEIDEWNLGCSFKSQEPEITNTFLTRFNWVHIFELFEFPLPSARPLLLLEWMDFPRYILRNDGQILGIFFQKHRRAQRLFLRRMQFSQLRKKIPKLFPSTDGCYFHHDALAMKAKKDHLKSAEIREEELWEFEDVRKDEQAKLDEEKHESVSPTLCSNNADTLHDTINKSNFFDWKLPKNSHFLYNLYWNPEGKMKVSSVENKPDIVSPFLRPNNADALITILNKLNRYSFLKFSKTCRYLNDFCWNGMGIKIPFDCAVDVGGVHRLQVWTGEKSHLYNGRHRNNLSDAQFERVLAAKQFHIQVELVHILYELNEASMAQTNEFLTRINCEVTERLWINRLGLGIFPEQLIQFVEQLRVKEFRCDAELPGGTLSYFLENMLCFHYDGPVPANFFLGIRVPPRLHLMGLENTYSFDTFMEILEGWGNGDFQIDEWNLGRDFIPQDEPQFIQKFLHRFEWIENFDLFKGPLSSARPLLLMECEFPRYLLRSDGQILGFYYSMHQERGLLLRQMKFSQLRKKIPILFPTVDKQEDKMKQRMVTSK